MKRALAERAKQSVVAAASREPPSSSSSSAPSGSDAAPPPVLSHPTSPKKAREPQPQQHLISSEPPPKLPKLVPPATAAPAPSSASNVVLPEPAPSSAAPPTAAPPPPPSSSSSRGAGHKRPRGDPDAGANSAAADSSAAFYLQHQNRALAVELRSLQHSLRQLERERDRRRRDCYAAAQALHSLQATWTQLETALAKAAAARAGADRPRVPPPAPSVAAPHSVVVSKSPSEDRSSSPPADDAAAVPSTWSGPAPPDEPPESRDAAAAAVEWTRALAHALADLGGGTAEATAADPHRRRQLEDDGGQQEQAWSSAQCASNLAERAAVLQERLWDACSSGGVSPSSLDDANRAKALQEAASEVRLRQTEVEELRAARDAAAASERRVRRNVYRLSAGMITLEQLVAAVQDDAEVVDADLRQEVVQLQLLRQREQGEQGRGGGAPRESSAGNDGEGGGTPSSASQAAQLSAARADALHARIADLEESVKMRDASIEELTKQIAEKERRITDLVTRQRSDDDVRKLQGLDGLSRKLGALESAKSDLEGTLSETRDKWAQARGDRDAAIQALEEQHSKFCKRWEELVQTLVPGNDVGELNNGGGGDENRLPTLEGLRDAHAEAQACETVELRHKLSQALENVRQAESTRQSLKDALAMNASLQSKLDEFKSKYASLRNSVSSSSAPARQTSVASSDAAPPSHASAAAAASNAGASGSTPKEAAGTATKEAASSNHNAATGSNPPSDKVEKMHREHRRMRKEIAAAVASKEAAKAKLERVEKERDSLIESNTRLLKQMTEKDEMNAKSLSTILHLKSMTEELKKERDSLEQQAKSANQLALTARLASNAKERVSEEIVKENVALEQKVEELEAALAASKGNVEALTVKFASASGSTATLQSEYENALNRCQELVGEVEKKNAEIRVLSEAVGKAERETREVSGKLQKLMKQPGPDESTSSGSTSLFTVDQLNTQISVLKNRLACPVCHYRDKECIIMRCRHMHCKQCVEERITNRSRKCPTCNVKFSDKDVEDVWLN